MKNKTYRLIAILGIFLGFAVVSAQAQAPSKVEVNIPFEFSAGKTTLQPGRYTIKRMSGNNVMLRSEDGESNVILNAPVTDTSSNPNAVERLVFERYGEHFALSQIWLTADTGRQVWTNKKGAKSQRVEIALRRNDGR
ncbi:MAG TPA: hypothetical protein VFS90_08250 [Pyrinomonadaceae bacterium]|nr:hypothetical protein [Pyrinomonadaceae bacterium]